jgi:hypothetical protein
MWSKDVRAGHVILAWLAEVCNGIKHYRKVHSSFTQNVGKITYVTYFTKQCQGAEKNTATVTCTVPDSPLEDLLAVQLPRAKAAK